MEGPPAGNQSVSAQTTGSTWEEGGTNLIERRPLESTETENGSRCERPIEPEQTRPADRRKDGLASRIARERQSLGDEGASLQRHRCYVFAELETWAPGNTAENDQRSWEYKNTKKLVDHWEKKGMCRDGEEGLAFEDPSDDPNVNLHGTTREAADVGKGDVLNTGID